VGGLAVSRVEPFRLIPFNSSKLAPTPSRQDGVLLCLEAGFAWVDSENALVFVKAEDGLVEMILEFRLQEETRRWATRRQAFFS
jgi:hypothetical protein